MQPKRKTSFWGGFVTLNIALLLILSMLSACASTSTPQLRGLDFCEVYEPQFGEDHPAFLRLNAIYLEFCLGGGQHVETPAEAQRQEQAA